jgi:hypothetical protein
MFNLNKAVLNTLSFIAAYQQQRYSLNAHA